MKFSSHQFPNPTFLSSLRAYEDIDLSPAPWQHSILHNFTKMTPTWPAIPPASSLIALGYNSSRSGALLKFPFLMFWGHSRLPGAPPCWARPLRYRVYSRVAYTQVGPRLCRHSTSVSLISSLRWSRIGPRATVCLHYFLYFQGDESVSTLDQLFFRVHSASFNSLVTNIDFIWYEKKTSYSITTAS